MPKSDSNVTASTVQRTVDGEVISNSFWAAISVLVVSAAVLWAYWPSILSMVDIWNTRPDYSHGWLVAPLSLIFLYARRDSIPWTDLSPSIWGALLLSLTLLSRWVAGLYYLEPIDNWTLPLALGGALWLVLGTRFIQWCWPSLVFLWFMIPIPYTAERLFSVQLQAIATQLSSAALIMLGVPAISEGNTILVGEHQLFVEEACSGLRIFFGIFALAFAFVLFSRWGWWKKVLVLVAALPVAILANVTRIVTTGLLYQWVSSDAGKTFSHDFAGFAMIPLAALVFWAFLVYLDHLVIEVEEMKQSGSLYATQKGESTS
ncbi:exosortase/archaeosortase family protein [Aeoliella mucimassa]|uniref:Transmembrane exosortase (Exosortase_EpsH) n=1 Tax=Aeoliella mucimassa TaxID=2527972 RepID=A0A518ALR2_9BACT|nr:exosortase/archaeosortase family protein [Aeoliella mucimassa]QDU55667.1 Transmembrane exosortase (Exosortase_EpsH) [Aeoliella mucimassa]